jgi:hypothetical protein
MYSHLADVIVVIHAAYVGYVIVGVVLILLGLLYRWNWIRNPWFRWSHFAMIGVVAAEAVLGIMCPLTRWENQLRVRHWELEVLPMGATQIVALSYPLDMGPICAAILFEKLDERIESKTFVGRCLDAVMFPEVSETVLNLCYYGFCLAVLGGLILAPPRSFSRPRQPSAIR